MKKITSAVLGLSLTLATAGLTFAAQDTKTAGSNDSSATTTKKHTKKHKKNASQTPAPAATNPTK